MAGINFSGLASGIDSNALIDAVSSATRTQRIKPNEKKVSELDDTNTALDALKTKLSTLQGQLRDFSTLNGGAIVKQGTVTDETVLTASASKSAKNGSYSITVNARAKNATFSFNDRFSSGSSVVNAAINDADTAANRTVTFTLGSSSPVTVNVVLTSTTTIADVVDDFNTQSSANGSRATASLVNVGTSSSPSYAITVNSNYEGLQQGQITLTSVGSAITGAGSFTANTLSQATDASLDVSGINGSITRASNVISDIIPGVTLNLNGTGTTTVTIADDVSSTAGKIQEWVDSWNDVVAFITENNKIQRQEDGSKVENVFSPLASERTDDNVLTTLRSVLASTSYDSGSLVRIFPDLGITTQRDGTLKFDQDTFESAVASESVSANEILMDFADETALTGGTIDVFIRFNGLMDSVINNNKDLITNLNSRIAEAEAQILRNEEQMRARFARLESLMGQMQNQQSALTSALAGLG